MARLAVTADGGRHWRALHAPDVRLGVGGRTQPADSVTSVVFANRRDGWLFGPGLWFTRDGGARWRQLRLGGAPTAMVAAGGLAYATLTPPGQAATELLASPVNHALWRRITKTATTQVSLAAFGPTAWLAGQRQVSVITGGALVHKYPLSCPKGFISAGAGAASQSRVAFFCADPEGLFHTRKVVLISADGGKTEHQASARPSLLGDPVGFAMPPGRPRVLTIAVITPALDYVARSGNGGRSWAQTSISRTDGGAALSSLAFASKNVGWLVVSQLGGQNRLLRTTDAGRTWHKIDF
jgi:hypothetical protein